MTESEILQALNNAPCDRVHDGDTYRATRQAQLGDATIEHRQLIDAEGVYVSLSLTRNGQHTYVSACRNQSIGSLVQRLVATLN